MDSQQVGLKATSKGMHGRKGAYQRDGPVLRSVIALRLEKLLLCFIIRQRLTGAVIGACGFYERVVWELPVGSSQTSEQCARDMQGVSRTLS